MQRNWQGEERRETRRMQEENGVKVSWLTRGQTSVSTNKMDAGWTLYLFIGQVMGWQDGGLSGMDQGPGMSTHKHASSHRQQRDTRTHVHGHRRARAQKVSFLSLVCLEINNVWFAHTTRMEKHADSSISTCEINCVIHDLAGKWVSLEKKNV